MLALQSNVRTEPVIMTMAQAFGLVSEISGLLPTWADSVLVIFESNRKMIMILEYVDKAFITGINLSLVNKILTKSMGTFEAQTIINFEIFWEMYLKTQMGI